LQGRTYDLVAPPGIDKTKAAPLLIMLHDDADAGASAADSGSIVYPWSAMDAYMAMSAETSAKGVLLALAHGTVDPTSSQYFWNATDACCDVAGQKPDDVGYVMGIVEDVGKTYAVDPKQIYLLGHGSGGFMANRVACDQADKIAAIASLGGGTWADATKCAASAPIATLEVHGDADMTVLYSGGLVASAPGLASAPGALTSTQQWAGKNLCNPHADTSEAQITLMMSSQGPDTTKLVYDKCQGNGWDELWTIHLGPHAPPFNASWASLVLGFLTAHPRP
jgi:polyhydroxybutyrate depolymerase